MLDPVRYEESCQLLRLHLVKSHKDKDDNSLFVRFGEILGFVEDLEWRNESLTRAFEVLAEHRRIHG